MQISVLNYHFSILLGRTCYALFITCALLVFSEVYAAETEEKNEANKAQQPGRENFVYPNATFRNSIDEVPRIPVKKFILNAIIDRPEQNITQVSIEKLVEEMRIAETDGFSIDEFKKVTDAITQHYRKAGFFLARAYIPEQDVKNDTVNIDIIEGILDGVTLQGNTLYTDEQFSDFFESLVGKPVLKDSMESSLLRIEDYPGLDISGLFQPGSDVGNTTLLLKTQSEKRFEKSLWLDNAGTEFTGEYRAMFRFVANNLTHAADKVNLNILQTVSPANSTYWSFGYDRPFFNSKLVAGTGYSNNAFIIGQFLADLDIKGTSDVTYLYVKYNYLRSRKLSLGATLDLSIKNAESSRDVFTIGEDHLSVLSAIIDFDFTDKLFGGKNLGIVKYSQGLPGEFGAMDENGNGVSSRVGSSGDRAGGDFTKINIEYNRLQPIQELIPLDLFKNQSLLFRLKMQMSDDLLVSLEQFPLGGPNSVRAYPTSEKLADSATFISIEWIARSVDSKVSGWLKGLQFSAFIDYASGKVIEPLTNEPGSFDLMGIGGAIQVSPKDGKYEARLDISQPLSDEEPSNGRNLQYFFKLGYHF